MRDRGRLTAPGSLLNGAVLEPEAGRAQPAGRGARAWPNWPPSTACGRVPRGPAWSSYMHLVWQRRHFIVAYATARNVSMYTEARLGQLWQVLTPLLNSAVYYLIFGVLFKANRGIEQLHRVPGHRGFGGRVSSFAECSVIKPPADELKICPSGSPSSRTPPGDYIWHAPMVHDLAGGPVSAANDALLRDFAIRAVEAQPFGYLHAVLSGLALAVEWPQRPYPDAGTVYYYYFHLSRRPYPADHSWIPGGTAYSDAVQYGHATPSRVVEPFAILIAGYERRSTSTGRCSGSSWSWVSAGWSGLSDDRYA